MNDFAEKNQVEKNCNFTFPSPAKVIKHKRGSGLRSTTTYYH